MRMLLIVALTAVLAWGLWVLLRVPDEEAPRFDEPAVQPEANSGRGRPRVTTGTLVVRVRTPSGEVPPGSRAGYLFGGEPRLKPVGLSGEARFTDAPVGKLTAVGRAPGYGEVRQQRTVLPGIRCDVPLVLRPEESDAPK